MTDTPIEKVIGAGVMAVLLVVMVLDAWLYGVRPDLLARFARFRIPLPNPSLQVDKVRRALRGTGDAKVRRYGSIVVVTIPPGIRLIRPTEILLVLEVDEADAVVGARWLPFRPTPFLVLLAAASVPIYGTGQFSLWGTVAGFLGGWMMLVVLGSIARASLDELMSRIPE